MKNFSNRTGGFIPALILAVMLMIGVTAPKTYAQYGDDQYGSYNDLSYQNFYDDLSPYGQWLNDPQYGYVWAPNVGRDFRPYYTNGYWMMTEYGNMWMSNYNWGWAPFHYGRWTLSSYYGWIWIPGNEWGPAWVSWRQGGGNYGWAPMGPGVSINISFGSGYSVPNAWWTFIPYGNIYARNFQRYYSPRQTVNIINNTTIINNTYVDARARSTYVAGPRRTDVEAVTRQRVNVYDVNSRSRAGSPSVSGRTVSVYRPSVREAVVPARGQQASTPAPRQFKTLDRSVVNGASGVRQADNGNRSSGNTSNGSRSGQVRESVQPGRQLQADPTPIRSSRDQQNNVRVQQQDQQRNLQLQQRQQQQDLQRSQQQQQRAQQDQQRNLRIQQEQQDRQRSEQMQRAQQDQQRNLQLQQQRAQQDQQRVQQQQDMQRSQQQQQQRMQQQQMEQQRNQQMQQQRVQQQRDMQMQQQRSIQQAQPQRVERSAPVDRSAPAVERSSRGR